MDLYQLKDDFSSLVLQSQPWMLTQFVMWLDVKLAEYKVNGYMVLDDSRQTLPRWIEQDIYDITARLAPKPPPCKTCSNPASGNTAVSHQNTAVGINPGMSVNVKHCRTLQEERNSASGINYSTKSSTSKDNPNVMISKESSDPLVDNTRAEIKLKTKINLSAGLSNVKLGASKTIIRHVSPIANCRQSNTFHVDDSDNVNTSQSQTTAVSPEECKNDFLPANTTTDTKSATTTLITVKEETENYFSGIDGDAQTYEYPSMDYGDDSVNSPNEIDPAAFPVNLYELQSGTDSSNSLQPLLSMPGRGITLPTIHDNHVQLMLEHGLAKKVWCKIITICSDHLMKITNGQPTSSEYQEFSKMFYKIYPSIASDRGPHPWTIFTKSVSQKIRRLRHLRKKELTLDTTC